VRLVAEELRLARDNKTLLFEKLPALFYKA